MKRRKFGVSFEKDIVYIKYIFGHYEIKYSDIEKIVYIKRSFRNNLIAGGGGASSNPFRPGYLNFFAKTSNKNKWKHFSSPFFFKYKDLDKIPQKLKSKLIVIDKLDFFIGITAYSELMDILGKLYNKK